MAGKGSARRSNAKRARARQERKKAAQQTLSALAIPIVTEDDLLAFQISHFADDTIPEEWFVPAETALNYNPALDGVLEDEDDDLGYYKDGVKRTLTDEQIEIFRHSEIQMVLREERLQKERDDAAREEEADGVDAKQHKPTLSTSLEPPAETRESHTLIPSQIQPIEASQIAIQPIPKSRASSQSSRSDAHSLSANPRRRRRKGQIPYEERNKRKWESFIEEIDPLEGSLTHRRIVREMDDVHDAGVKLDY